MPAWIGLGLSTVSTGLGIFGASQADKAAQDAQMYQDRYNKRVWLQNKKRLKADYKYAKKSAAIARQNEKKLAEYKDKNNLRDYEYGLKIREFEYTQLMRQFEKSQELYGQQLSYNNMAAAAAKEAEMRRLEDATNEIAFQNQDIVIKAMEAEGAAAVKGQQGRSAGKSDQALLASLGRNQAILAESLLSAQGETDAALNKIASDKFGADIAAEAARMLKPKRTPKPKKPLKTPVARIQDPRKPKKADFGPKPLDGTAPSSIGGAVLSGLTNLAGGIAGFANANKSPSMNTSGMNFMGQSGSNAFGSFTGFGGGDFIANSNLNLGFTNN